MLSTSFQHYFEELHFALGFTLKPSMVSLLIKPWWNILDMMRPSSHAQKLTVGAVNMNSYVYYALQQKKTTLINNAIKTIPPTNTPYMFLSLRNAN